MITQQAGSERRFDQTLRDFQRYLRATGGRKGRVGSEGSIRTYGEHLKLFWSFCTPFEVTPYDADAGVCDRFFEARRLQGISSSGRTQDLAALRHFYAWLKRQGYREDDPTADVAIKKQEAVPTKPHTEDELDRLLGACHHERDKLLFLVLAATGMRIGELEAMQAEHIDWRSGTIRLQGKGAKERLVRLPHDVLERLRLFVGMLDVDGMPVRTGPIWQALHYPHRPLGRKQLSKILVERIGRRAGVEVHPHRLRATFAVNFLRQYRDVHELAGRMGHADINTTAQYLRWLDEERALDDMANLDVSLRLSHAAWRANQVAGQAEIVDERQGFLGRLAGLFRTA